MGFSTLTRLRQMTAPYFAKTILFTKEMGLLAVKMAQFFAFLGEEKCFRKSPNSDIFRHLFGLCYDFQ
jgi:hypothetical protein